MRQSNRLRGGVNTLAAVHLDGDVGEPGNAAQPLLVGAGRLRVIGDDGGDQRGVARPEAPEMQVAHPVAVDLQTLA